MEPYNGTTLKLQHNSIKKLFIENKELYNILEEEWVLKNLLFSKPIPSDQAHPLFFILANWNRNNQISQNLITLKERLPNKYNKIISKIKKSQSSNDAWSKINEIETYITLSNHFEVEWEPTTTSGKKPDLCVNISKKPIYLEVFSIFSSKEDKYMQDLELEFESKINSLNINKYIITIFYEWEFYDSKEAQKDLLRQIKNELQTLEVSDKELEYSFNGNAIANVRYTFCPVVSSSYLGCYMSPVKHRNDGARIKSKILKKFQDYQMSQSPDFCNAFVIYLEDIHCGLRHFNHAIYGPKTVTFYSNPDIPLKSSRDYAQEIQKHEDVKSLIQHIDFFAVNGRPEHGWQLGNCQFLLNENTSLKRKDIEKMFCN